MEQMSKKITVCFLLVLLLSCFVSGTVLAEGVEDELIVSGNVCEVVFTSAISKDIYTVVLLYEGEDFDFSANKKTAWKIISKHFNLPHSSLNEYSVEYTFLDKVPTWEKL